MVATFATNDLVVAGVADEGVGATVDNTRHAFFNDTRPEVHDPDAARQAWVRTLEFLRAKLG